ncbi:MAG: hypothetical protein ACKOAD_00770 [Gammaproteobacteria bacterium]
MDSDSDLDLVDVSNTVASTGSFLYTVSVIICFILGGFLFNAALMSYKAHKENPDLVSLDKPIIYFILGLAAATVPFWSNLRYNI